MKISKNKKPKVENFKASCAEAEPTKKAIRPANPLITSVTADVIYVNHSGGKDSQAMLIRLIAQGFKGKIVIVHADLGDMEWEPMHNWLEKVCFGLEIHVVKAERDFFELARHHNRIPGGQKRWCSGKLKAAPINKFIKEHMVANGYTTALSAIGIRRTEGGPRKNADEYEYVTQSISKWHPVLEMTDAEVFQMIKEAGQVPHWVYSKGLSRLSCAVCVYGRVGEHKIARELKPELFQKLVELERELGKTIRMRTKNKKRINYYLDELK
jgi:DNA sulfur modification protein DndC